MNVSDHRSCDATKAQETMDEKSTPQSCVTMTNGSLTIVRELKLRTTLWQLWGSTLFPFGMEGKILYN